MLNSWIKRIFVFSIIFLLLGISCISITGKTLHIKDSMSKDKTERLFQDISSSKSPLGDPPNLLWKKTFGGPNSDRGHFIQQTSDNGYIITGNTKSYGIDDWDVLVSRGCQQFHGFMDSLYDWGGIEGRVRCHIGPDEVDHQDGR